MVNFVVSVRLCGSCGHHVAFIICIPNSMHPCTVIEKTNIEGVFKYYFAQAWVTCALYCCSCFTFVLPNAIAILHVAAASGVVLLREVSMAATLFTLHGFSIISALFYVVITPAFINCILHHTWCI